MLSMEHWSVFAITTMWPCSLRYLPLEDISMFSSASCSKCVLEKDREHLLKILLLSRASVGVLMVFMFEC